MPQIDIEGYGLMYSIMLSLFVFELAILNPKSKQELLDCLRTLCDQPETVSRVLKRLEHAQALLPKQERRKPDTAKFI